MLGINYKMISMAEDLPLLSHFVKLSRYLLGTYFAPPGINKLLDLLNVSLSSLIWLAASQSKTTLGEH